MALLEADRLQPFDLLIVNAGIHETSCPIPSEIVGDAARQVTETNILGTFNTLSPLVTRMVDREYGQIGILSSPAGFIPVGTPTFSAYTASKAWGAFYGQCLRAQCKPFNVGVTVLCPGFTESGMLRQIQESMQFKRIVSWLSQPTADAVKLMRRALSRDLGEYIPTFTWCVGSHLFSKHSFPPQCQELLDPLKMFLVKPPQELEELDRRLRAMGMIN